MLGAYTTATQPHLFARPAGKAKLRDTRNDLFIFAFRCPAYIGLDSIESVIVIN